MTLKKAIVLLALLLVLNGVGMAFDWYISYPWHDSVLHFLGGAFAAVFVIAKFKNYLRDDKLFEDFLFVVGVTVFIGVLWEFAEYTGIVQNLYGFIEIKTHAVDRIDDLMTDLTMDTLGAMIVAGLYLPRSRKGGIT